MHSRPPLEDCHISWPRARFDGRVAAYRALFTERDVAVASARQFLRDFDLIGAWRPLKVLRTCARLRQRDGKPGCWRVLSSTLADLRDTCARYGELPGFRERHAAFQPPRANLKVAAAAAHA